MPGLVVMRQTQGSSFSLPQEIAPALSRVLPAAAPVSRVLPGGAKARGAASSRGSLSFPPAESGPAPLRRSISPAAVAPPRSVLPASRRTPASGATHSGTAAGAPPVPSSARGTAAGTASVADLRRSTGSLVDSTAHLFGPTPTGRSGPTTGSTTGSGSSPFGTPTGGEVMRSWDQETGALVRRSIDNAPDQVGAGDHRAMLRRFFDGGDYSGGLADDAVTVLRSRAEPPAPSLDMDEVVDRVVRRIEERVIDELERRGRRHQRDVLF